MTRDIDPQERQPLDRERDPQRPDARAPGPTVAPSRERKAVQVRGYRYQISPAELETMRDIGRFRTIAVDDLARHHYGGKTGNMRDDLDSLRAQGLIERRTVWTARKADKLTVVVLTKLGKEILEGNRKEGSSQQVYAGFVKPAEVRHDAAIYRMYQAEKQKIERAGGRVRRVVLDYELKQKVYSPLAKAKAKAEAKTSALSPLEYARRQAEVARQNGLKVVRGRILLPDLRIEYDTQAGARAQVDLELATHHYRGAHLRGKAEAGFKMYAPADSARRLSAAFDPELMAEIFSL